MLSTLSLTRGLKGELKTLQYKPLAFYYRLHPIFIFEL